MVDEDVVEFVDAVDVDTVVLEVVDVVVALLEDVEVELEAVDVETVVLDVLVEDEVELVDAVDVVVLDVLLVVALV